MAMVYVTDDGITYCSLCGEEFACDECGDMPSECPCCGDELDWSEFDKTSV